MSKMITFTTPMCTVCGQTSEMTLDAERVRQWREGAHIQVVFPGLSEADRELLISGTHKDCWDELFDEEED